MEIRHLAHLRAARLAAEVALLVAALIFLGFLSSHPIRTNLWTSGGSDRCVYFGRAGSSCDASDGKAPAPPAADRDCVMLGRAGRYCPDTER